MEVTGEADISAENINIGGREATTETTTHTKVETETLAIGVKNAYADTALAIKAVADAAAALEDAKEDLDDAKRNVRNGTLAASALDDYKANLAAATAQLTQAGIAAVAAGATAAATTGTGGFYVSGSAEKSVTETTTTNTSSTFNGSSINLGSGKLNAENKIEVTGSTINVVDNLEINADDIIVKAGIEETTETSSETTRTAGATASYGASGASGGVNASGSNTDSESYSKTHINSTINAGSLNSTSDNLTLSGANVEVAGNIDIDTGNLTIESLQDESSSSSKTEGYNASVSKDGDVSGGANQNSSNSDSKWVNNQTTLIGGTSSGEMGEGDVNINADSTTITGATVASATRNEDGSLTDNSSSGTGSLNLATDELVINNLQDKDHSESEGFDVSGSSGSTTVGLTSNGHKTEQDTLATLGGGNITKKDGSEHDVSDVNSDLNNSQVITKDQQTGGLDATVTVDHRLLSGDGLKDIAEDFEDTVDHAEEIGKSVKQVATLDTVGIEHFAGLVNDKAEMRTGVAQIHDQENEEGENELRDVINDSEASAEETQDALSALAQALTGDESQQVDLYSEGENGTENLKGFYDDADGQIALNTQQTDMTDVSDKVEVVGHESYHAKLDQEDSGFSEADREALAHDAGERTSEHWNKENRRDGITTSAGSNADWNKNNQNSNTISFGNASVADKNAEDVEPLLPLVPPILVGVGLILGDVQTANAPAEGDNLDNIPQSRSVMPTDVAIEAGVELAKENLPESLHTAVDVAAMIGNPKTAVDDVAGIVSDLGKKGDVPNVDTDFEIGGQSNINDPVSELDVDSYKELKRREVVGDDLEHDHIPSSAAIIKNQENELGPLTAAERRLIHNEGTSVEVPKEVHADSRTYRGRNTQEQINEDAKDLAAAACRDCDVFRENAINHGMEIDSVDSAIDKIHEQNVGGGVYTQSELDDALNK